MRVCVCEWRKLYRTNCNSGVGVCVCGHCNDRSYSTNSTHYAYAPWNSAYLGLALSGVIATLLLPPLVVVHAAHFCHSAILPLWRSVLAFSRRHGCQRCVLNWKEQREPQTWWLSKHNGGHNCVHICAELPGCRRGCRLLTRPRDNPWHTKVLRRARIAKVVPVKSKQQKIQIRRVKPPH